ncbi:MAG: NfeD family protein [Kiritimatiellae bacterium]|nr:NfeD family protein [Kiritimatiellia bacterium]MBR3776748.1 NfeD family protein [Kiritimatiellia bacterium]
MFTADWIWLYIGAALMMLELISPGFVVFFFGLAAATTGVLTMFAEDAFTTIWQVLTFAGLSIVYLVFLRRVVKKLFSGTVETSASNFEDDFPGKIAVVTEDINTPLSGRVMLGDAEWTAVADVPIEKGVNVRVVVRDNLTLKVERV